MVWAMRMKQLCCISMGDKKGGCLHIETGTDEMFRFTKGTLKKKFAKKLREIDQTWQHYKTAELFLREKELKDRNVI